MATRPKIIAISRSKRVFLPYVSVGFVSHIFVKSEAHPHIQGTSAVFDTLLGGGQESRTEGNIQDGWGGKEVVEKLVRCATKRLNRSS